MTPRITKGAVGKAQLLTAKSEERYRLRDVTEGRLVLQRFLQLPPAAADSSEVHWADLHPDGVGVTHRTNLTQPFFSQGDTAEGVLEDTLDQMEHALVHGKLEHHVEHEYNADHRHMAGAEELLGRPIRFDDQLQLWILRPLKVFADVVTDRRALDDEVDPGGPISTVPFMSIVEISLSAYSEAQS